MEFIILSEEEVKKECPYIRQPKPEGQALKDIVNALRVGCGVKILKEHWPYKTPPGNYLHGQNVLHGKLRAFNKGDYSVIVKIKE